MSILLSAIDRPSAMAQAPIGPGGVPGGGGAGVSAGKEVLQAMQQMVGSSTTLSSDVVLDEVGTEDSGAVAGGDGGGPALHENVNDVGARTRELVLGASSCPWLQPSGIGLVGSSDARVGFRFERLDPTFVQILACLSGEGEVYVNGQWARCGPGQAYITPQRQPHAYRALPGAVWLNIHKLPFL